MMRNEISAETHLFMYVYAFLFYRLEGILAKLRKLKLCGCRCVTSCTQGSTYHLHSFFQNLPQNHNSH